MRREETALDWRSLDCSAILFDATLLHAGKYLKPRESGIESLCGGLRDALRDAFPYDGFVYDAFPYDAFVYDTFPYDAFLNDAFLYDAFSYDAFVYDAFPYDAFPYDAFVYNAFVYDAFVYDAFVYDAFLYDDFPYMIPLRILMLFAFSSFFLVKFDLLNVWFN